MQPAEGNDLPRCAQPRWSARRGAGNDNSAAHSYPWQTTLTSGGGGRDAVVVADMYLAVLLVCWGRSLTHTVEGTIG